MDVLDQARSSEVEPIPSLAIPGQIDYSPRFAFAPAGG